MKTKSELKNSSKLIAINLQAEMPQKLQTPRKTMIQTLNQRE